MGFDSLVCAGCDLPGDLYGVRIYSGLYVKTKKQNDVARTIRRSGAGYDIVLVDAGDASFNRAALSVGGTGILRGIHDAGKRAFDDVCGRNAADNFTAVDLDLSAIICRRGISRQKALEAFAEVMKFQRKFGFPVSISSGAASYVNMRSPGEIVSLCGLFGMEDEEVYSALGAADSIVNRLPAVGVVDE